MSIVMPLLGLLLFFSIAWFSSSHRRAIKMRIVVGVLALQLLIGLLLFWTPLGRDLVVLCADLLGALIAQVVSGSHLLFGFLPEAIEESTGVRFAFRVLPVILFSSALLSLGYYVGWLQALVRPIAHGLQKYLKISRVESMTAAANLFVGHAEAPLLVRPFIAGVTNSELFALMTVGMATSSLPTLAGYIVLGVKIETLLVAMLFSLPGALLFAKIMLPENNQQAYEDTDLDKLEDEGNSEEIVNLADALSSGALNGLRLALNIGAVVLTFVCAQALLNAVLLAIGAAVGAEWLSLNWVFGWVFAPVALLIGIPWSEAQLAGTLLGQKLFFNEFVAYLELLPYLTNEHLVAGAPLSELSKKILSVALSSFASFASIGILAASIGRIAPKRRKDVIRLGGKSLLAATLANLFSAALVALFLALRG